MNNEIYDIIIVGGGHAGLEAAYTAAKFDVSILIISMNYDTIGQLSCNPSIGGIAKGNVVRDLDALGGLMPILADMTAIQYRRLNSKKGPAVQSIRVQSDRNEYAKHAQKIISLIKNITVYQDQVTEFVSLKNSIEVKTERGMLFRCRKIIFTTGTFLTGTIFIGDYCGNGGRIGEFSSISLSESLIKNNVELYRFKTGTPPRVKKSSIDFSKLLVQEPDNDIHYFSRKAMYGEITHMANIPCHIAKTNQKTLDIIIQNKHKIPLYSGKIKGLGPRYCPSFEDKVFKFADKSSHLLFVEPEGINTELVYLNGISTSLEEAMQKDLLRTIKGFEDIQIFKPAYAVEYDVVNPMYLKKTLEHKHLSNCYFAGQINGTSGYEEAAGQGFIAGINAALSIVGKTELTFPRHLSYIGVMIDDLTTKGIDEPYRLFTSRAEHRMLIRMDNAYERLLPISEKYSLLKEEYLRDIRNEELFTISVLKGSNKKAVSSNSKKGRNDNTSLKEVLLNNEITNDECVSYIKDIKNFENYEELIKHIRIELKYSGYVEKELQLLERNKKMNMMKIPKNIEYPKIPSLSTEARQRLAKSKPISIGEAALIQGIKPTDIMNLIIYLKNYEKKL